jgi:hypothetical protein
VLRTHRVVRSEASVFVECPRCGCHPLALPGAVVRCIFCDLVFEAPALVEVRA